MAVNKEELLETISNMTVLEVVELVEAMEEKFGVSAAVAAAPAAGGAAAGDGAAAEEKTEFDVILTGFGEKQSASSCFDVGFSRFFHSLNDLTYNFTFGILIDFNA